MMEYKIWNAIGDKYLEGTQSYIDEFTLTIKEEDKWCEICLPKSRINDLIAALKQIEKRMKEDSKKFNTNK